MQDRIRSISC